MTSQVNEGPQIKLVFTDDGADDAALTPLAAVFLPLILPNHTHTTTHSFHTYYPNYCAHNKRLNFLFLVFIAEKALVLLRVI